MSPTSGDGYYLVCIIYFSGYYKLYIYICYFLVIRCFIVNQEAFLCAINVIYIYFIITAVSQSIGDKMISANITNVVVESTIFFPWGLITFLYLLYIYKQFE